MEKINVAELLKDCPSGMELDCTMFIHPVTLDKVINYVNENYPIVIKTHNGSIMSFTKYGTYTDAMGDAKCVIYPKGKTTWEGFHKPFKDGDIIYTKTKVNGNWLSIYKELEGCNLRTYADISLNNDLRFYCNRLSCNILCREEEISVQRLANEEEKEKLFQVIKENGYRWNSETKTLEELIELKFKVGDIIRRKGTAAIYVVTEIREDCYMLDDKDICLKFKTQDDWELVPDKFDITTLKPFDKVLARDCSGDKWNIDFFGCYRDNGTYQCMTFTKNQCIPYKENEHLLGTTNDCDDFYKTW